MIHNRLNDAFANNFHDKKRYIHTALSRCVHRWPAVHLCTVVLREREFTVERERETACQKERERTGYHGGRQLLMRQSGLAGHRKVAS